MTAWQVLADLTMDPAKRMDPMERILPIVTMCDLSHHGKAGGQTLINSICVLPKNIVHQIFYVFLWFWLLFLTVVTAVHQVSGI